MKQPAKNDTIIIFGFSGAGKSTVAERMGKHLGLRVIHPSSMLQALMLGTPLESIDTVHTKGGRGFWESPQGVRLLRSRLKEKRPPDTVIDKILLRELRKGRVVMESWNMPWLFQGGIKIYLQCPRTVRALRVAKRSRITPARALAVVRRKDEDTQKMFKRVYGMDIKKDTKVFDLIIPTAHRSVKKVEEEILLFFARTT